MCKTAVNSVEKRGKEEQTVWLFVLFCMYRFNFVYGSGFILYTLYIYIYCAVKVLCIGIICCV